MATLSSGLESVFIENADVPITTFLFGLSPRISPNAALPIATLSYPPVIYHAASAPMAMFLAPYISLAKAKVPSPMFRVPPSIE